ncbi:MAG: HlyD family efflux transporter periplasmic adaptor subunit [Pontiellaceae bacterium]|nr:HlyD family efflux transporter periplasmic adaptor subunit [Pontiellaceae bacterium]
MTNKQFKRPPLRMRRRHMLRQLFSSWPWLVWIGAATAIMFLIPGSLNRVRFDAKAESIYQSVSPDADGRLSALNVQTGDLVTVGQVIGKLDLVDQIDAMMDQAKLEEHKAEVASISNEIYQVNVDKSKTEVKLQALKSEQNQNEILLEQGLKLVQEIEDLAAEIEATEKLLALFDPQIASLEAQLAEAKKKAEQYDPESLRKIAEQQSLLTASMDGMIAQVEIQPGDFVERGDTVVRISNRSTRRVTAFMPEMKRMDLVAGERCRVITKTTDRSVYHGKVHSVTADIRKLPSEDDNAMGPVQRGRRILIELDEEEGEPLLPGEQVVVVPDLSIFEQWFGRKK